MQEDELFTIWLDLFIICLYPANNLRMSTSRPTELVISLSHYYEHLELRFPVMANQ